MTTPNVQCQCEHDEHHNHNAACTREAAETVRTIYGTYHMCQRCAEHVPAEYLYCSKVRNERKGA